MSSPEIQSKLTSLKRGRVLNPSQWSKLYPAKRSSVSSEHFDITLLMVLLRNICSLVPPATGWDTLPPTEDKTLEADIVRIKCYRNTLYGHATKASVKEETFSQYWKAIQDPLVRLGGVGYQSAIDDLKKECMDPEFEEHYKNLLKQWVMDEVSIKERLDRFEEKFHKKFDDLKETVANYEIKNGTGVEGNLIKVKYKEDVNILILGETGVGKSTWINAIANYLRHDSLKAAIDADGLIALVPFKFTFTNERGEGIDISFGSDANEDHRTGQSATQSAQEYSFETDNIRFHLIDTPGIGDCRGIDMDKENFETTLAFLTNYDKINAVVVLLKPNNPRLTVAFRFCVLELLTHLHKSLVSNIIFAFTNSRGTFYKPGDSLPVLKQLLEEQKIEIDISPSNYFCFDNEAFRFLACNKKGIEFTHQEISLYSESWDMSFETTARLFHHVMEMKPHETKKTLSLNEARNFIIALGKPMAEAVGLLTMNLKNINDEKEKAKAFDSDINTFRAKLKFKGYGLKYEPLDYPMTVCAEETCKRYVKVGEENVTHTVHDQICHDHCYLEGVPLETINNERLFKCKAMRNGNCQKCSHSFKDHMHITYNTTLVEKEFLSQETQKLIMEKEDMKSRQEAFIAQLREESEEYEKEKDYIYDCASFFAIFLKKNALIPYNDAFGDYIDMLIKDEEVKKKEIRDGRRIEKLKEEKLAYEEKKKLIKKTMANSEGKFKTSPIEKIYERKEELCSLRYNGKLLRKVLDGGMSARQKVVRERRMSLVQAKGNNRLWSRFIKSLTHFKKRSFVSSNHSISDLSKIP